MAARSPGISGLAVGLATAGGLLLYSAIKNVSVVDALRDVIGKRPIGTTGTPTGPAVDRFKTAVDVALEGGSAPGVSGEMVGQAATTIAARVVEIARAQLGKPYVWGAAGPNAYDCSGLVSYCLQRAGVNVRRMVTTEFLVWSGAATIARDQCRSGDLVCWTGHIGIATGRDTMIHAPSVGDVVKDAEIWPQPPPTIRRLKG